MSKEIKNEELEANKENQNQEQEKMIEDLKETIREEVKAELLKEMKYEKENSTEIKLQQNEKVMLKQDISVKKYLDSCPKVKIEIPDDPLNTDSIVPIGFNGVIYAIPRGKEFEVPKPIYDIWKESYENTKKANKRAEELMSREMKEITILS